MNSLQKISMGILEVLLPKFKNAIQLYSSSASLTNASAYLTNFIENTVSALWLPETLPNNVDTHVKNIANEIINVYNTIEPTLVTSYVNREPSPFFAISAKTIKDNAVTSVKKTNNNTLTNTSFYCSNESKNLTGLVGAYQITGISVELSTITNNELPSFSSATLNIHYFNGSILGGNPFINTIQLQTTTANALQDLLDESNTKTMDYATATGVSNTSTAYFNGSTTYVDSELFLGVGLASAM